MYELTCDTCSYSYAVETERTAYSEARDHEAAHPTHMIDITERSG